MRELQEITALAREQEPGAVLALATVVRVRGSAYRRPGARMLICASGRSIGMISGGCLEGDVRERARQVMISGKARLVTYDSTSSDDIVFGLGLGCGGIVEVLIEPLVAGDETDVLALLATCQSSLEAGRIATVYGVESSDMAMDVAIGTRLLQWPDGALTSNTSDPALHLLLAEALQAAPAGRPSGQRLDLPAGGALDLLIETIAPPIRLLIFGAGDDAIPVAQFARLLGWHVTVVDARPAYALPERFPMAHAIHCLHPDALRDCPPFSVAPGSLAIVMTHNYLQDRDLLRTLLPLELRYLGVLGPMARTQRLLSELKAEGVAFTEAQMARLHGPVGLDIGAETPEEVALSVLAEMRACLANRNGGPLRERKGGIHDPGIQNS